MPTKKRGARVCKDPRGALLDAAEALFSRDGLGGVSTRQIAAKAGCNVALISYYYKGKESLYEAVITRYITQIHGSLTDDLGELERAWPEFHDDSARRLAALLHAVVEGIHGRPSMQRIMMHEMASGARTLTQALAKAERTSSVGQIIEEIRMNIQSGHFRKDLDPRYSALSLMAPLIYSCLGQPVLKNAYGFPSTDQGFRRVLCLHLVRTAFHGWA